MIALQANHRLQACGSRGNLNLKKESNLSVIALANLEALAGESSGGGSTSGEEFVFTCGRSEGRCWEVVSAWGPYCTCEFTGWRKDFCVFA
ncbi:hypothetical protein D0T49_13005 [Paludibacter sp. 221]|uniref:hypothetical protein n=1 Tax=Paludibacter sp. 221 TaxID=2302939 RepID=UPI0013D29058|nr:hypothetical protein [Paludibacter sp. 221]NDV47962.1 hypothetical protein [Paludibacter sp. 221]